MNRREFISLMGLAGGASVLSSCNLDRQTEKIIPYVVPPDDGTIPGVASYVATTSTETPECCGVSAKVMDYRVGKLEGLAGHPTNDGALGGRDQASLGKLYHPNRLKTPLRRGEDGSFTEISWEDAYGAILAGLASSSQGGAKNVLLSRQTTGSLAGLIDTFCSEMNVERLPEYEHYSYSAIREANRIVFGRSEIPDYRIDDSDFLLTIGADIFETFVSPVANGVRFAKAKKDSRFAWYHVEPHMSLAGLKAKHRFVVSPGSEAYLLAFLLRKVSRRNLGGERHIAQLAEMLPGLSDRGFAEKTGLSVEEMNDIARHLLEARRPLVVAGGISTMQEAGLDVAVMTALLQWATDMTSTTVDFSRAHDYSRVGSVQDIGRLGARLQRREVGVAFFADVDPLGGAVAPLLSEHVANARLRVGAAQFMTDTMQACDIVLPLSDTLESWGDARPRRGLLAVIQPAVAPIHDTRALGDMLLELLATRRDGAATTYQDYVAAGWRKQYGTRQISRLLREGFLEETVETVTPTPNRAATATFLRAMREREGGPKPVLYVTPSLRAFDGSSRAVALLSEVPDPLTTVTWGAWVSVSRATAEEMNLSDKDEVTLSVGDWLTDLPAIVQPGLARGVMTLQYNGVDPAPMAVLTDSGEMSARFDGVGIRKTGRTVALPVMAGSKSQEGRGVIPEGDHGEGHGEHHLGFTLYPDNPYKDYRWGMAIDLDLCTGCNACTVACYVENNVPVVGAELHLDGREMSWLRMEPFYSDEGDGTDGAEIQPMLCQHCSDAPCETVCPVFATYHNENGLNAQIYNRCVGTRYCLNNCPYKVRRFNWFDFKRPTELNTTRNPEVSVRGRGVMEKCTFCVQRVRAARDTAKDEKRKIADGEVVPACAQTCPTNAIVFGNLLDEHSEVSKWAHSDRAYRVFELLGTQPAVHYLRSKWKKSHA